MNSKVVISLVVFLQISIIIFLGNKILRQKNDVLGNQVINPIKKENIITGNSELKHFYEPKPGEVVIDTEPFPATYTINEDSLNERYSYTIEKPQEVFRIITLGDSFTYGQYVNTEENWTELLEDQLNLQRCENIKKYEVINLGMHGYDIQYAVERYRNRGIKYNPDLVLWLLKRDDVFHINEIMIDTEMYYREKMKESGEYQIEFNKGNVYPSWERAMHDMMNEYGRAQVLNAQEQFLNTFRDMYKDKMLMISFENDSKDIKQFLSGLRFIDENIYYFDNLRTIYNDQRLYLKNDYHPTVEGHKQISEEIYSYILKKNLINCD